jgi:hypothetical protein
MTIEQTMQGIRVSDIIFNQRVSMHYIGYSKKQAKRRFKEYIQTILTNYLNS